MQQATLSEVADTLYGAVEFSLSKAEAVKERRETEQNM